MQMKAAHKKQETLYIVTFRP